MSPTENGNSTSKEMTTLEGQQATPRTQEIRDGPKSCKKVILIPHKGLFSLGSLRGAKGSGVGMSGEVQENAQSGPMLQSWAK